MSKLDTELTSSQRFCASEVHLKVEAKGSCKTHVATTQTQDAIRQFQFLEQSFHMVQHLLVRLFGMFRLVDAHQFYFGEFVQTVQAAYVFTV